MPGRHVTDHQMRLFMQHRQTDAVASAVAKASMSKATGRRIARTPRLPSANKPPRGGQRPDPLGEIFNAVVVPKLQAALGSARLPLRRGGPPPSRTRDRHPSQVGAPHPDLARRERARAGSRLLASRGSIVSPKSAWPTPASSTQTIPGGESFVALAEALQKALWLLCGVPLQHRTDSLSAALRNLDADAEEELTTRHEALCAHYGMAPTRKNAGAIRTATLLLRASDFPDLAAYHAFVDGIVGL